MPRAGARPTRASSAQKPAPGDRRAHTGGVELQNLERRRSRADHPDRPGARYPGTFCSSDSAVRAADVIKVSAMSASRQTRGRLNMQPPGLKIQTQRGPARRSALLPRTGRLQLMVRGCSTRASRLPPRGGTLTRVPCPGRCRIHRTTAAGRRRADRDWRFSASDTTARAYSYCGVPVWRGDRDNADDFVRQVHADDARRSGPCRRAGGHREHGRVGRGVDITPGSHGDVVAAERFVHVWHRTSGSDISGSDMLSES